MKKTMIFENEFDYDNWFEANEEKEDGHDFIEDRVVIVKGTRTIQNRKFNGFSADATINCKNVKTAIRRFIKELKSNGFNVSEDEFESDVHCFTDCGYVVEIEEIDDDRFYINYMCYQNEVEEEATEPETATETELETATETEPVTKITDSEVDYDVDMHIKSEKSSYYWDGYTVKATTTDSAKDKALNRLVNETGINKTSCDCIRVYKSGETEILKEWCYEAEKEKIPDLKNFNNAIIKTFGMTIAKGIGYTVQGVNVFFEFKGNLYKCYTPQSKLYKLSGQRFNLITWRDLKKESDETDDISGSMYTSRSPPESSLLNLS